MSQERKDPYKIIDNLLELYDRMDELLDKQKAQASRPGQPGHDPKPSEKKP